MNLSTHVLNMSVLSIGRIKKTQERKRQDIPPAIKVVNLSTLDVFEMRGIHHPNKNSLNKTELNSRMQK